jgi:hypothetical protein
MAYCRDQQAKRKHALGERHGLAQQHGRERRAQRDRHHQIECVQLGERALARDAQQADQRNIGERSDQHDATEPAPGIEQHGCLPADQRRLAVMVARISVE